MKLYASPGRPRTSLDGRLRETQLTFRVTEPEHAAIITRAKGFGVSVADWCRRVLLAEIRAMPNDSEGYFPAITFGEARVILTPQPTPRPDPDDVFFAAISDILGL